MASEGSGCLAGLGLALLVIGGLYAAATVETGGVRQVDDRTGETTQVLTWQGWRPAGGGELYPSPVALRAERPAAPRPAPSPWPSPRPDPPAAPSPWPPVAPSPWPTAAPWPTVAPGRTSDGATPQSGVALAPDPPAGLPAWAVGILAASCGLLGGGLVAGLVLAPRRWTPRRRPAPPAAAEPVADLEPDPAEGGEVPVSEYLGQCLEV